MRKGFTTGSCAAAAAKAACSMLFFGQKKTHIKIETPAGITFDAEIVDIEIKEDSASCAVIKDGGDDPDVTTGSHVCALVTLLDKDLEEGECQVLIEGGRGVGRVTLPGLDQPVGSPAINSVPRAMIEKEVMEVLKIYDFHGSVSVVISIPEGEELAGHTFNPRLGIVGGISVLGTTGIVEPMSSKALIDTIGVELRQRKAMGLNCAYVSPGNYGQAFMKEEFGFDLDKSVKCSNFIGETVDLAGELGFETLVITGHIGKLIKVAGGIMNTHSHEADCRMEIMASAAIRAGSQVGLARQILECLNTEEAIKILDGAGLLASTMQILLEKILFYLNFRSQGKIKNIEVLVFSTEYGLLAMSENIKEYL
ncbi:MAG: cobalt-precorrin-5B (C(1))-methyltransferase CbiD [Pseudobutyrivibrio sp.]|nr:cobalt-precorrin-5B (C(1))-methyltransferase CbiD [Pseudobutyrivibrio sp.]